MSDVDLHALAFVLIDKALEEGAVIYRSSALMPWAALILERAPFDPQRTYSPPREYGQPGKVVVARSRWEDALRRMLILRKHRYIEIVHPDNYYAWSTIFRHINCRNYSDGKHYVKLQLWNPPPTAARRQELMVTLEHDMLRLFGSARLVNRSDKTFSFRVMEDLDRLPAASQCWSNDNMRALDHRLAVQGFRSPSQNRARR